MGTNEKRCNNCLHEFYETEKDMDFNENDEFVEIKICPKCGSPDWEYKLIGKERI